MIERVYNKHLIVNRKRQGKPFTLKKDFSDIENHKDYKFYDIVATFLEKKPEIDIDLFFEATAYFLSDSAWVPISEYAKSKALTNYVQYIKLIESLDLDESLSLRRCIETFKFIKKFISEKDIDKTQYLDYIKDEAHYPEWMVAVKRNQICRYSLFAFPDFISKLQYLQRDPEMWEHFLGGYCPDTNFLLKRWNNSVKFRKLAEKAYKKI